MWLGEVVVGLFPENLVNVNVLHWYRIFPNRAPLPEIRVSGSTN